MSQWSSIITQLTRDSELVDEIGSGVWGGAPVFVRHN
jgi:hypothetical protein